MRVPLIFVLSPDCSIDDYYKFYQAAFGISEIPREKLQNQREKNKCEILAGIAINIASLSHLRFSVFLCKI